MLRCVVIDAVAICRIACTVTFAVVVSHHRALRRPEAGGGVDVFTCLMHRSVLRGAATGLC